MGDKVQLVFIWHMHQPYYVNPVSDVAILPWVRLHSIKEYYDMARLLELHPKISATINLVPSLIAQLEQYVRREITDTFLEMSFKEARFLTEQDKLFLLKNFFLCHWDHFIKPYPRFAELLAKRGRSNKDKSLLESAEIFSIEDYRDLQVWFNLTWFGESIKREDSFISEMIDKDRLYTESDKTAILEKQFEVMGKVIPKYKALLESGQIEISTTPFYHPILPLICDTNIAQESNDHMSLPKNFNYPIDAQRQIRLALNFIENRFGKRPIGIWPSEGALSNQVLDILIQEGVRWTASDQHILTETLIHLHEKHELGCTYNTYRYKNSIELLFRDRHLSENIGYNYRLFHPDKAAKDFINQLEKIAHHNSNSSTPPVVSIILDGENPWEKFKENGWEYLNALYQAIENNSNITTVTVNQNTTQYPAHLHLDTIFPGSWLGKNLNIWIGHEEDNKAWELLLRARQDIENWQQWHNGEFTSGEGKRLALAWEELYISEGSDWTWWYGDDFSSKNDREFDELFRQHILNIYEILGMIPPPEVFIPIKKVSQTRLDKKVKGIFTPTIDGRVTDFYEWHNAGMYNTQKIVGRYGEMPVVHHILFGYDLQNFYLRVDLNEEDRLSMKNNPISIILHILNPTPSKIFFLLSEDSVICQLEGKSGKCYETIQNHSIEAIYKKILEAKIPLENIGARSGNTIQFLLSIEKNNREIERWPIGNIIECTLPTQNEQESSWVV